MTPPCAVAVVVVVDEEEEDWRLGGMFLLLLGECREDGMITKPLHSSLFDKNISHAQTPI